MNQAHWSFASDRSAAADARSKMRTALCDVVDEQRDIAVLLTNELFSNAVIHGAAPIDIEVDRADASVRVTVHDGSPILPLPSSMTIDKASGRGFVIVNSLAERWGITVEPGGKSVWFEIATN